MTTGPVLPRASRLSTTPPAGRQRVAVGERRRAAQAGLLGVGEHEHDVVARSRARWSARGPPPGSPTCRRRRRCRPVRSAPSRSGRRGTPGRSGRCRAAVRQRCGRGPRPSRPPPPLSVAGLRPDRCPARRPAGRGRAACSGCARGPVVAAVLPATCVPCGDHLHVRVRPAGAELARRRVGGPRCRWGEAQHGRHRRPPPRRPAPPARPDARDRGLVRARAAGSTSRTADGGLQRTAGGDGTGHPAQAPARGPAGEPVVVAGRRDATPRRPAIARLWHNVSR